MPEETVVVILAGGKGSRITETTGGTSKCLLPIGSGQNLLGRAVYQISDAKKWKIIVCCSPENHLEISTRANIPASNNLIFVACEACQFGPIRALEEVVRNTKADHYLLWLADIFFYENPVSSLLNLVYQMKVNGYVVVGKNLSSNFEAGSGFVESNGERVTKISYKPTQTDSSIQNSERWSGLFLFDSTLAMDLIEHSQEYSDKPLEVWLGDALLRGFVLSPIFVESFVNINSQSDYEIILGTSASG
jgi:NDP-sugar pyrophosphorylase family protein